MPYPEACTVILVGGEPHAWEDDDAPHHYLAASGLETLGRVLVGLQEAEVRQVFDYEVAPRTIELGRLVSPCLHVSCAECGVVAGDEDDGPWHLDPEQAARWLVRWGWRRRPELEEIWVCEQCAGPDDEPRLLNVPLFKIDRHVPSAALLAPIGGAW